MDPLIITIVAGVIISVLGFFLKRELHRLTEENTLLKERMRDIELQNARLSGKLDNVISLVERVDRNLIRLEDRPVRQSMSTLPGV